MPHYSKRDMIGLGVGILIWAALAVGVLLLFLE